MQQVAMQRLTEEEKKTVSGGYIDNFYTRNLHGADTPYPPLMAPMEADVCVIGGGLAGINTALGLLERGKKVILVEAKRIGWGASGRNGGFVAKGYAADEASLASKLGLQKAQELVSLTKNARKTIQKRIAEYNIDCGPIVPGVMTVSTRDRAEKVQRYIDKANADFDLGFEFWGRDKVREHCKTEKYFDAVYSPHDFQFNPLMYLHGLAKQVVSMGGRIFENSPALKIERVGEDWRVTTPEGSVKARHVVLCCAIYSDGLDKRLENAAFPVQTYMMSTTPVDEKILKSAINTSSAIYEMLFCSNYYRMLPGNRILWGGKVGLWAHPHDIAQTMLEEMFTIYPQLRGYVGAETAWAGQMCYAPHKMPQIGQFEEGYWYNTCFGGHGLCPTTAGGEAIADAIAEGGDVYKRFAPFKPFYTGGKLGRYAAQLVYGWWRARDYLNV